MAKQKDNLLMRYTRGMIGKQVVFKKRAGKTYVAAAPVTDKDRKPTKKQLLAQQRLVAAARYAETAIKSPELRAAYQAAAEKGQSANNVAFLDAYHPPEVMGIIAQGYHGQPGNLIVVMAIDDFKVDSVKVSIVNSADELVEEGAAVFNAAGFGCNWTYLATQTNAKPVGSKITATAVDLPGNQTSLEVIL